MNIYGLMQTTLLDFPGHVACTVFTGGCNMRCPFCHNYQLATMSAKPLMHHMYVYDFLQKRKGVLDGVAITGGEPTLHKELVPFIKGVKELGFKVKLDTNGTNPKMLDTLLKDSLVDYVAMDVKNSPEKYAATAGVRNIDIAPIRESIRLLIDRDVEYEFRTTVVNELHEPEDFDAIGEMIQGARVYFLQPFVDREVVPFKGFSAPDYETVKWYAHIAAGYVDCVRIRGY